MTTALGKPSVVFRDFLIQNEEMGGVFWFGIYFSFSGSMIIEVSVMAVENMHCTPKIL